VHTSAAIRHIERNMLVHFYKHNSYLEIWLRVYNGVVLFGCTAFKSKFAANQNCNDEIYRL